MSHQNAKALSKTLAGAARVSSFLVSWCLGGLSVLKSSTIRHKLESILAETTELFRRYGRIAYTAYKQDKANPRPKRHADDVAFLPAALEIVESPPSPLGRAILWTIMALFVIAITWACLSELDLHATAEGRTLTQNDVLPVQAQEAGRVEAINVANGDHVVKGDVVLVLDPTEGTSEVTRLEREVAELEVRAARLKAQMADAPLVSFVPPENVPGDLADELIPMHLRLLQDRVEQQRATLSGYDNRMASLRAEQRSLQAETERLTATIPLMRQRVEAKEGLADKGYSSRLQAIELKEGLLDREHELDSTREKLKRSAADQAQANEERSQAVAKFRAETMAELAEVKDKASGKRQELERARQLESGFSILAPNDGIVQQLAVRSAGAVVTKGQTVLVVVPENEALKVEARLLNKDVPFVEIGQQVEVKIEALPFTLYGTVPGTVTRISASSVDESNPSQNDTPGSAPKARTTPDQRPYVVEVKLDKTQVPVGNGRIVTLIPGMNVTAEIKTGQRRVIQYLLDPILRTANESFRER
jgi:hemolysin D